MFGAPAFQETVEIGPGHRVKLPSFLFDGINIDGFVFVFKACVSRPENKRPTTASPVAHIKLALHKQRFDLIFGLMQGVLFDIRSYRQAFGINTGIPKLYICAVITR